MTYSPENCEFPALSLITGCGVSISDQDVNNYISDAKKQFEQNKRTLTKRISVKIQELWIMLSKSTNSAQLKGILANLVLTGEGYKKKIDDYQTTDEEINSIIDDLIKHLNSIRPTIRYYTSSWVNLNAPELVSMIKPILILLEGLLDAGKTPTLQKIEDLQHIIKNFLGDIKKSVDYFNELSQKFKWGAIATGIIAILCWVAGGPVFIVAGGAAAAAVFGLASISVGGIVDNVVMNGDKKGQGIISHSP